MQKLRKLPRKSKVVSVFTCTEKWACKGLGEKAVVWCNDCASYQCSSCDDERHKGDLSSNSWHTRDPVSVVAFTSFPPKTLSPSKVEQRRVEIPGSISNCAAIESTETSPSIPQPLGLDSTVDRVLPSAICDNSPNADKDSETWFTPDSCLLHPSFPTESTVVASLITQSSFGCDSEDTFHSLSSLALGSILDKFSATGTADRVDSDTMKQTKKEREKSQSGASGQSDVMLIDAKDEEIVFSGITSEHPRRDISRLRSLSSTHSDEDIVNELIESSKGAKFMDMLSGISASPTVAPAHSICGLEAIYDSKVNDHARDYTPSSDQLYKRVSTTTLSINNSAIRSFKLIDDAEDMQVKDADDLVARLKCTKSSCVKVVSIFGNTGAGKSYTLNHTFFGGSEVFKTSADQDCCTVGVWAAYDDLTKVVCLDTEGLLGISSNQNRRTRLLLKVLAISDVVIFRTSADRLHTDMFQFLGDASTSYTQHFKSELEGLGQRNGHAQRAQDLGPAVIVFHETTRTNTLDTAASISRRSASEILRERFAEVKQDMSAFSSIHYIGTQTRTPPTDFSNLIVKVKEIIKNTDVRSARPVKVIFEMLMLLNQKFNGEINSSVPSSFPAEFFTCPEKCMACHRRCSLAMNHRADHCLEQPCAYVHVYDNKVFLCRMCYTKGKKNRVVPKTHSASDNVVLGAALYAWSGYVLECHDCGIIYRSRQHWYGNRDPEHAEVQMEVCHIWPGQGAMLTSTHNAAWMMLDGAKVIKDTVTSFSSRPARILGDWVADKFAPPYWRPNSAVKECCKCCRSLGEEEKKHHCRSCGEGFCDDCTQFKAPVPERGWGPDPVRVCEACYKKSRRANHHDMAMNPGAQQQVLARQMAENLQSVIGTLATITLEYPSEVIKQNARPSYWVADHLIKNCRVCNREFGAKLCIHHCRNCGQGVCEACSNKRCAVPSRGWDRPVRVCDTCYGKERHS